MDNELYIGQTLRCKNNELVIIIDFRDDRIFVDYKGKVYERNRNIVGVKLFFLEDDNYKNEINYRNNLSTASNELDLQENINLECCNTCMLEKRGDCYGNKNSICENYKHAPSISNKEIENWPKFGDATYYRMTNRKRNK